MRDYDLEDFLKHYGVPGMKRPRGLKYKTGNINSSLYKNRKAQMYRSNTENTESSTGEWKKWKYIKDTNNKIESTDSRSSGNNNSDSGSTGKPVFKEYKYSRNKRDQFRRARQSKEMTEANIKKAFEKQKHMFDKKKKSEHERELENANKRVQDAKERLKEHPLTRYGIFSVKHPTDSKLGKSSNAYRNTRKNMKRAKDLKNGLGRRG